MIQGNTKLFTEAESHFADAKFYMDEEMVPEALPKEIKSTGKVAPKKKWQAVPKEQEGEAMPSSSKDDGEPAKPATTKRSVTPLKGSNTPFFRYIPKSRRKKGESLFEIGTSKADTQLHKDDVKLLKTNSVLPLTPLGNTKVSKPPQGFVNPCQRGQNQALFQPRRPKKVWT